MNPTDTLKKYVNLPSGSHDKQDCEALAAELRKDFAALGMRMDVRAGKQHGPALVGRWGQGDAPLMLMGHYDTVFPRASAQAYRELPDGWASGSGIADMKGGIAVMLHALRGVLPQLDPHRHAVAVVLNGDEEVGSPESRGHIMEVARSAFAALSFEPTQRDCLVTERKGVTAFELTCTGIGGHAGSFAKHGASAIQSLCEAIGRLYALRDDARDISVNIGTIQGGTADNVIASTATAAGEFRSYDPAALEELRSKVEAICAQPSVPDTTIQVTFGATHPACKQTPESLALYERAKAIAREQGRSLTLERTGGAGDISFAASAGIPVLDGLGPEGSGYHTKEERALVARMPMYIDLAERLILDLFRSRDRL